MPVYVADAAPQVSLLTEALVACCLCRCYLPRPPGGSDK